MIIYFLNHYLENVNAHGLCIDAKGQIFLTHIFSSTFFLHNKTWKKGFGVFFPFHNAPMLFSSISASVMLFFTENSFMDEIFITNYSWSVFTYFYTLSIRDKTSFL